MKDSEISSMIAEVIRKQNPNKLIEAIENDLRGLLDNEDVKTVILDSLKGRLFKKPAHRTPDTDRNAKIFVEMSYLLFDEVNQEKKGQRQNAAKQVEDLLESLALERHERGEVVPKEFAVSWEQVLKIYRKERKKRGYEN